MITIINYGSGNISAIANVYTGLKIPFRIAETPEDVAGAERIILPGVGAFDETISKLDQSGLRKILDKEVLENKVPVLGICVGMQILASNSEEGDLPGLGWIDGSVKMIDKLLIRHRPKIPHLGWNSIRSKRKNVLLSDVNEELGFYFLHSFYFECSSPEDILSETFYGTTFASAINHGNIFGVQFHPEKSHSNGIKLLDNFSKIKC